MSDRFGLNVDFEKSWDEGVKGIRNCQFKFQCDKKWADLEKLDGMNGVRFCADCQRDVHYIDDAWDLALALDNDWCVAIARTLATTAKAVKNINEPLLGSLVSPKLGRKDTKS